MTHTNREDWTQIVNRLLIDHEERLTILEQLIAGLSGTDAANDGLRTIEQRLRRIELLLWRMSDADTGADGM